MVRFACERSKKMLPAQATLTRPWVVALSGTVMSWLPELAAFAASVTGKLWPASVDSEMFTWAQLTGAWSVLATFQITFWVLPMVQVSPAGAVTRKGPALVTDVTIFAP